MKPEAAGDPEAPPADGETAAPTEGAEEGAEKPPADATASPAKPKRRWVDTVARARVVTLRPVREHDA